MFFPKPPPKRQLANPVALAALVDLLASEEEAVLHPALTLLVTVVRGGLEIPLSAGARGRIVVRCLRHACEGRCAELCAELLGAEAVAAPPARLSDGGMGGAGKKIWRICCVHVLKRFSCMVFVPIFSFSRSRAGKFHLTSYMVFFSFGFCISFFYGLSFFAVLCLYW